MKKDEETFRLSPMLLFKMALKDAGLIKSENDPRAHNAWRLFEYEMQRSGYIEQEEKQNDLPA